MNTALSRSFLLMSTESSFFSSGRMEIARILKFGIAVKGLPWMVTVFSYSRCLSFSSCEMSEMKLQWM